MTFILYWTCPHNSPVSKASFPFYRPQNRDPKKSGNVSKVTAWATLDSQSRYTKPICCVLLCECWPVKDGKCRQIPLQRLVGSLVFILPPFPHGGGEALPLIISEASATSDNSFGSHGPHVHSRWLTEHDALASPMWQTLHLSTIQDLAAHICTGADLCVARSLCLFKTPTISVTGRKQPTDSPKHRHSNSVDDDQLTVIRALRL